MVLDLAAVDLATFTADLKSVAFPLGTILFALYPLAILVWTVAEGSAAASSKEEKEVEAAPVMDGAEKPKRSAPPAPRVRRRWPVLAVGVAICAVALPSAGHALGFIAGSGAAVSAPAPTASVAAVQEMPQLSAGDEAVRRLPAAGLAAAACLAGLAVAAAQRRSHSLTAAGVAAPARSRAGRVMRLAGNVPAAAGEQQEGAATVPRYSAPPHEGISLWHDVELFEKSWLDEPTGVLRYVNEMPMGCLQKFEVMPHLAGNAIEEDPKGSSRLGAFGVPVPFNYGCFPQTYRDPNDLCELHGAPGDDDPLDVLDLCGCTAGVGEVVRCIPLGAVCLIDEGQADWKVLAVNIDSKSPLAEARSIEDVERISPGRVKECLQWIDDFKQSSGKGEAELHFEVHSAEVAMSLIKEDYAAWQRLLEEAGPCGTARGHWIRPADAQAPVSKPVVLKLGWQRLAPRVAVPGQLVENRAMFTGAGRLATLARARPMSSMVTRRETTVAAEVAGEV